jgi:hypothetical protein
VVWFYTRDTQTLTLETRYDNATHEFVGILTDLAGPPITKRFATPESFREWIVWIERDLATRNWKSDGPPHILPDGWADRPWSL